MIRPREILVSGEVAAAFLESVSEQAVTGRLPLRSVPLDVRLIWDTAGVSASWKTEGKGRPVSSMALDSTAIRAKIVQALTVVSDETLRFASIAAEEMIRNDFGVLPQPVRT